MEALRRNWVRSSPPSAGDEKIPYRIIITSIDNYMEPLSIFDSVIPSRRNGCATQAPVKDLDEPKTQTRRLCCIAPDTAPHVSGARAPLQTPAWARLRTPPFREMRSSDVGALPTRSETAICGSRASSCDKVENRIRRGHKNENPRTYIRIRRSRTDRGDLRCTRRAEACRRAWAAAGRADDHHNGCGKLSGLRRRHSGTVADGADAETGRARGRGIHQRSRRRRGP